MPFTDSTTKWTWWMWKSWTSSVSFESVHSSIVPERAVISGGADGL